MLKIGILNENGLQVSTQLALEELEKELRNQALQVHYAYYSEGWPKADLLIGDYQKSALIRDLVDRGLINLPLSSEALLIQELELDGKISLLACAYDTRGLDYALYELAERVGAQSLLALHNSAIEKPAFPVRRVCSFFTNMDLEADRFFNPEYWRTYFSFLVKSRINSFTLIFGEPSSPFTPLFPYILEVPEHPEVTVAGLSDQDRERNQTALLDIISIAADYGLEFILGLRQLQAKERFLKKRVVGLTAENLDSYTYSALIKLITKAPDLGGVYLSCSHDSGMSLPEKENFLVDLLCALSGYQKKLILSTCDLPAKTIGRILKTGLSIEFTSDYRQEGGGVLPYQPTGKLCEQVLDPAEKKTGLEQQSFELTHFLRGYSSQRILLWGDSEHLRRLFNTLNHAGSSGFMVWTPLAQKGYGDERGKWDLLSKKDQHYQWEFERYWYFYRLYGRLGYQPKTTGEVLLREFNRRFGKKGPKLERLYQLTGKALTLYNTAHQVLPLQDHWPEIDTGGLLDLYLKALPADPEFFSGIEEFLEEYLTGRSSGKISPLAVANRLEELGQEISLRRRELEKAGTRLDEEESKEWRNSLRDFGVLENLAFFHAYKIRAAINLGLYYRTRDLNPLLKAADRLKEATGYWRRIITMTEGAYHHWMVTGPVDSGHWKTKLPLLRDDEERLRLMIREYRENGLFIVGFDFGSPLPEASGKTALLEEDLYTERGYHRVDQRSAYSPEKGFGWKTTVGLYAVAPPALRLSDPDLDPARRDTGIDQSNHFYPYGNQLLNDLVTGDAPAVFRVDLAPGTYRIRILLCDRSVNPSCHGPMSISLNEKQLIKDLMVPTGKRVVLQETLEVKDRLMVNFSATPGGDWFISALNITSAQPVIAHTPIRWNRGDRLVIKASVSGLDQIKKVSLFYRLSTESEFKEVAMRPESPLLYWAELRFKEEKQEVYYYLTATDNKDRTVRNDENGQPFFIKWATADRLFVTHTPPKTATDDEDLELTLSVKPGEPVTKAILCYRWRQAGADLQEVLMEREDPGFTGRIPKESLISGDLIYYFRLVAEEGLVYPDPLQTTPYYLLHIE